MTDTARSTRPAASPAEQHANQHVPGLRAFALVAVAVGIAARLYGLDGFILEQDELYTVREATELWDTDLLPGITARPLYFLMQHVLLKVTPVTAVWLRIPPFVFGVLGIWMTWALARRVFGREAAVASVAIVSLAPWHVYMSGMARYWSTLYFLSAAFFLCYAEGIRRRDVRYYLGALAALLAGAAVHPTFLFPLVGVALGGMLIDERARLRVPLPDRSLLLYLWLPAGLLLLAAVALLVFTGNEGAVQNWSGRGLRANLRLLPAIVEWTTPILAAAGGLGMVLGLTSSTAPARRWSVMALLGTTSTLVLLSVAAARTDVYADYAAAALPLVIVSAGGLVHALAAAAREKRALLTMVPATLIVAGMAPTFVSHMTSGTRFDYRPAFEYIRRAGPDVPVITWPLNIMNYYAPDLEGYLIRHAPGRMDAYLEEHVDLWVVTSVRRHGIAVDETGDIARWIGQHCRREASYERPRMDYRMYRVDVHRCRGSARAEG